MREHLASCRPDAPVSAAAAKVVPALRSPGRPLDPDTQSVMESRFGHDFSRVRIHTDARAAESARALRARAYTVGEDLVFGPGAYEPEGAMGRRRIAHELAHVVQQTAAGGGPVPAVSSPSDASERSAETAADRVMSDLSAGHGLGAGGALVSREVEAGWQDGGPKTGWSIDPTGGQESPSTNVLQEFDVDRPKGGKPWNLDRLMRQIAKVLAESPDRYIEVVAYYHGEPEMAEEAGGARKAALKRADVTYRALLEWAPKLKGRLRKSTRDRDLLMSKTTRRQVAVEWGPFGLAGGGAPSPDLALPAPAVPAAPGEAGSDVTVPPEEYLKRFFGDGIEFKKDVVSLSIKGLTGTLYRAGPTKATVTAGLTASLTFKLTHHRWNFSGNVSPTGSWEVRLSFPRETWLPDAMRLKAIMERGGEAAIAIAKNATDPEFYKLLERAQKFDFEAFKDIGYRISPYVDPIRYAIDAAQGAEEYKGGVSFGAALGSGPGPGGPTPTPEQAAAGGPKGMYFQGVLTFTF